MVRWIIDNNETKESTMEYTCKHCGHKVDENRGDLKWYGFKCDDCQHNEDETNYNLRADKQEEDKRIKEFYDNYNKEV